MKQIKIGLSGNPNSGKTTLFNSLTGSHQKVGNYAGVTIEKKEGRKIYKDYEFIIYDLPGTYSLTAYSIDEVVARDFIIEDKPDIIIDVLDSNNIERNLYLCLQFQELKIPIIGALNIIDQAEEMGIRIDEKQLSKILDIPMVKTVGPKGKGITEILDEAIKIVEKNDPQNRIPSYGDEVEREIEPIVREIEKDVEFSTTFPSRWMAIKLLEKDENAYKKIEKNKNERSVKKTAEDCIKRVESHFGRDSEIVISEQRYAYIHGTVKETVVRVAVKTAVTERVDSVLLNRILALPIFLFILWAIFQMTFLIGAYPKGWIESFFGWLVGIADKFVPPGVLSSLIIDGVIAGFGNVISFIPQVVILFMFISILEDSGYMARAAFIMDKFLHIFGLHGQSFLPMMTGFGCSVPAIMASRTLKSNKDRIITVLVTPFMSCGAKFPVHVVLAGAFFASNAGNVIFSIYIIGVILALVSSSFIRKMVLKGESTPFVMELPPYRLPTVKGILWHIWDKSQQYFKKAGTIILAASIVVWAITSFPKPPENNQKYQNMADEYKSKSENEIKTRLGLLTANPDKLTEIRDEKELKAYKDSMVKIQNKESTVEQEADTIMSAWTSNYTDNLKTQESLSYSIAGRIGKFIEPAIRPLGFDWKIGIAMVTGFAAKEVVVSTMGTLYSLGSEQEKESETLKQALQNDKTFNPLVAYVLMLFVLILAPCFAAQAAIKAELGWRWLGFYYLYTTLVAWGICFAVYQVGKFLGFGG